MFDLPHGLTHGVRLVRDAVTNIDPHEAVRHGVAAAGVAVAYTNVDSVLRNIATGLAILVYVDTMLGSPIKGLLEKLFHKSER